MTLSQIQAFDALFAQLDFKNGKGAATYYVLLIEEEFPTTFENIKNHAKEIYKKNIRPAILKRGRDELFKNGVISQAIFLEGEDRRFGREMFLPVDPLIIWENNKEQIRGVLSDKEIDFHEAQVNELSQAYHEKYGEYGMGIRDGSITLAFNKNWLLYTITNIFKAEPDLELYLLFGSLDSFTPPLKKFYEGLLNKGLKMKVLFDNKVTKNLENLLEFKEKYRENIQFKYTPISHVTIRRVIFGDKIALDGRKILAIEGKRTLSSKEVPYIGTVYVRSKDVSYIKKNFESAWESTLEMN